MQLLSRLRHFSQNHSVQASRSYAISQITGFAIYAGLLNMFPLYLQLKYHLSEDYVVRKWTLILSIAVFIGLLARTPMAIVVEKIGRVRSVTIAFFSSAIISYLLSLTDELVYLILLFSILRSTTHLFPLSARSVTAANPDYKGPLNGILGAMTRVGSILGSSTFGLAIKLFKPDYMLYLSAFLALCGLLLFFLFFVPSPSDSRFSSSSSSSPRPSLFTILRRSLQSEAKILLFLYLTSGVIMGLTQGIHTLFAKNKLHIDVATIGFMNSLAELCFIIVSPLVGFLLSRTDRFSLLITGGFFIQFLSLSSIVLYPSPLTYLSFIALTAVANAIIFTTAVTYLTYTQKQAFTFIFGVFTSAFFLGQSLSVFLTGHLYNMFPLLPFAISAFLSITIAILTFFSLKSQSLALSN